MRDQRNEQKTQRATIKIKHNQKRRNVQKYKTSQPTNERTKKQDDQRERERETEIEREREREGERDRQRERKREIYIEREMDSMIRDALEECIHFSLCCNPMDSITMRLN